MYALLYEPLLCDGRFLSGKKGSRPLVLAYHSMALSLPPSRDIVPLSSTLPIFKSYNLNMKTKKTKKGYGPGKYEQKVIKKLSKSNRNLVSFSNMLNKISGNKAIVFPQYCQTF
jgi:hypothetical protein